MVNNEIPKKVYFTLACFLFNSISPIVEYCRNKIGMSFGIGTSLTNDAGPPRMNIEIKITEAKPAGDEWTEVIKLSVEPGKYTGSQRMISLAKTILKID